AYTALGLPLALAQVAALADGDGQRFFLLNAAAVFVDATDGVFARAVRVWEVLPDFDGRKLDDIIDFITFSFLPAVSLVALGLVPMSWAPLAALVVLASAYGFCQERAKTEDSFVGFPSYWNIVVFYLWLLDARPAVVAVTLVVLAVLVFVPIHYVYPTRAVFLKPVTVALGYLWGASIALLAAFPHATWSRALAFATLGYPLYYTVLSAFHHRHVSTRAAAGPVE
ncbi:MAG: hypothetical protein H0V89_03220, partial [Deltaproteobacteria bacterium]|nr:hypothetical protein [Deltaproteobacteria bacterium]